MTTENITTITVEEQIYLLELRIKELNYQIAKLSRPIHYDPSQKDINTSFGFNKDESEELLKIMKYWLRKHGNNSPMIIKEIIDSPLPVAEKMCLCVVTGVNSAPPSPSDGPSMKDIEKMMKIILGEKYEK